MGLGKPKNNNGNALVFLRDIGHKKATDFKGKDGVPYFEITRRVDEEWKTAGKTDSFNGNLVSVSIGKKFNPETEKGKELIAKWKGNPYEVKIELEDPVEKETYIWKAGLNIATRSLFNALLSADGVENIEISLYKDSKNYDKFTARQHGVNLPWKFELKDIPKPVETLFKGETLRDYTEIDEFYVEKLKEKFSKDALKKETTSSSAPEKVEDDEAGDEIPF